MDSFKSEADTETKEQKPKKPSKGDSECLKSETTDADSQNSEAQIQPRRTTRKQPVKEEKPKTRDFYMRWTEDEKKLLLVALEAHGPREVDKISEVVGTRSRDEVMCALKYWKKEAAKSYITTTFSINKKEFDRRAGKGRVNNKRNSKAVVGIELWIDVMLKHLNKTGGKEAFLNVASAVKMIASFEALPTVEEADGIDFRELYLWLAEMLSGQPMRSLNVATSTFLTQCTRDLSKHAADNEWPRTNAAVTRIVDNVWCPKNIKSYSKKKQSDVPTKKFINERMQSLLDTPGINTVALDMDRLVSKQTV